MDAPDPKTINGLFSKYPWSKLIHPLHSSARLAGFDFPDWDLLRGNVAPTPEQQDALARFTAFTYLVTMGVLNISHTTC